MKAVRATAYRMFNSARTPFATNQAAQAYDFRAEAVRYDGALRVVNAQPVGIHPTSVNDAPNVNGGGAVFNTEALNGKETPRRYQAIVVDDYPSQTSYWAQADATNCTKDATMAEAAYELTLQADATNDRCRALPAPDLDPGDHDVEFTLEHDIFTSGAVPLRITEPNLTLALNDATLNRLPHVNASNCSQGYAYQRTKVSVTHTDASGMPFDVSALADIDEFDVDSEAALVRRVGTDLYLQGVDVAEDEELLLGRASSTFDVVPRVANVTDIRANCITDVIKDTWTSPVSGWQGEGYPGSVHLRGSRRQRPLPQLFIQRRAAVLLPAPDER